MLFRSTMTKLASVMAIAAVNATPSAATANFDPVEDRCYETAGQWCLDHWGSDSTYCQEYYIPWCIQNGGPPPGYYFAPYTRRD